MCPCCPLGPSRFLFTISHNVSPFLSCAGKIAGRVSHCLDIWTFICLRVQPLFTIRTHSCDPGTGCGLKIKVLGRHLKMYSPTATPGEHEGFGLRCKEKGEQRRKFDWILVGPVSLLLRCKFHTVSITVKEDVKHTGRYWCWKAEALSCEAGWQMRVSVSVLLTCLQDDSCCFSIPYCANVLSYRFFSILLLESRIFSTNVWMILIFTYIICNLTASANVVLI